MKLKIFVGRKWTVKLNYSNFPAGYTPNPNINEKEEAALVAEITQFISRIGGQVLMRLNGFSPKGDALDAILDFAAPNLPEGWRIRWQGQELLIGKLVEVDVDTPELEGEKTRGLITVAEG